MVEVCAYQLLHVSIKILSTKKALHHISILVIVNAWHLKIILLKDNGMLQTDRLHCKYVRAFKGIKKAKTL